MDEARLSPQMGRLIDEAKAAALRTGPAIAMAEGVAVLTCDGSIYAGRIGSDPSAPTGSAAEAALAAARRAGHEEILAAAVAIPGDGSDTVLPSAECRRALAGIDADLPVVIKHRGRWVLVLLSQLPSPV
jgi:hypothetical protein